MNDHHRVFITRRSNRPAESAGDRLRWAFPEIMVNRGMDVIKVDAVDYRGQRATAVVEDILRAVKVV